MEDKKERVQEDHQIIQEQIIPQKKRNRRRFWRSMLRIAVSAVVFGVIAGVTLVLTGNFLIKKLGLEKTLRQMVGIGTVTQAVSPNDVPSLTKAPGATKNPTATGVPTPPGLDVTPPGTTPEIFVTIDGNKNERPEGTENGDDTVLGFLNMYPGVAQFGSAPALGLHKCLSARFFGNR